MGAQGSAQGKAPDAAAAAAPGPAAAPAAAPSTPAPAEPPTPAEAKAPEAPEAPEPPKDAAEAEAKGDDERGTKPKEDGNGKGNEGEAPKGKEGAAGKAVGKEGRGKEGKGKEGKGKDAKGKDDPKGKGKEKGTRGAVKGSGPTAGGSGYRLNVKNLGRITEEELKKLFEPFGTVSMAEIKKNDKGESRGFGFVVLSGEKEGMAAAKEMNGKQVKGTKLNVAAAERRAPEEDDKGKGKGKGKAYDIDVAQAQQAYAQQWAAYTQMLYLQRYQQYAAMQQPSLWAQYGAAAAAQEYEGSLKSVKEYGGNRSGYGFIVCKETYDIFGRDVYVDESILPQGAARGSRLVFTVNGNEKGHPKAVTCRLAVP